MDVDVDVWKYKDAIPDKWYKRGRATFIALQLDKIQQGTVITPLPAIRRTNLNRLAPALVNHFRNVGFGFLTHYARVCRALEQLEHDVGCPAWVILYEHLRELLKVDYHTAFRPCVFYADGSYMFKVLPRKELEGDESSDDDGSDDDEWVEEEGVDNHMVEHVIDGSLFHEIQVPLVGEALSKATYDVFEENFYDEVEEIIENREGFKALPRLGFRASHTNDDRLLRKHAQLYEDWRKGLEDQRIVPPPLDEYDGVADAAPTQLIYYERNPKGTHALRLARAAWWDKLWRMATADQEQRCEDEMGGHDEDENGPHAQARKRAMDAEVDAPVFSSGRLGGCSGVKGQAQ